jgi:hypothetical protein
VVLRQIFEFSQRMRTRFPEQSRRFQDVMEPVTRRMNYMRSKQGQDAAAQQPDAESQHGETTQPAQQQQQQQQR